MGRVARQKYSRTQLQSKQIDLLKLVYKYRFVTRQLVADSLGINQQNGLHRRLKVLVDHGYLGVRYDTSYKLAGRPAEYYLTPQGLRILLDHNIDGLDDKTIRASYKDKTASEQFIRRSLTIQAVANRLTRQYPLQFFTRRDLTIYYYFPPQPPDGFVSIKSSGGTRRYFFDLCTDNMPPVAIEQRLSQYIDYEESGAWDETGTEFPVLLMLCENGSVERRARKHLRRVLHRTDSDITIYTTTQLALLDEHSELDIWTSIEDDGELLSLL